MGVSHGRRNFLIEKRAIFFIIMTSGLFLCEDLNHQVKVVALVKWQLNYSMVSIHLKVNGHTFKRSNSAIFMFASLHNEGQLLKEKICSYRRKLFPLRVDIILDGWIDDLGFYISFHSISIISERWEVYNERLCEMEPHLQLR